MSKPLVFIRHKIILERSVSTNGHGTAGINKICSKLESHRILCVFYPQLQNFKIVPLFLKENSSFSRLMLLDIHSGFVKLKIKCKICSHLVKDSLNFKAPGLHRSKRHRNRCSHNLEYLKIHICKNWALWPQSLRVLKSINRTNEFQNKVFSPEVCIPKNNPKCGKQPFPDLSLQRWLEKH